MTMDGLPKANILLVDDQEENLIVFDAILAELGQNLIRARSGAEALKVMLQKDIAVVLLDVIMPDLDGFETASLIREREKFRHIPIIFVTGINMHESHIFKGYSLGAVDYILKPFAPEILKSKVAVFVELFLKTQKLKRQSRLLQQNNEELKQEIRERERFEQELRKLNETLEERVAERTATAEARARDLARANSELENFTYIASHDLKEPLRMIASYCDLLQIRYKDGLDKKAREYIGYAVDGALRMRRMIDNLLSLANLSIKGASFEKTPSETAAQEAIHNLRIMIRECEATVTYEGLPVVTADKTQLMQVFQNLIGNGIKFRDSKPPQVRVSARLEDKEWIFSVEDNGIGVDPEYREQIFAMFRRLHNKEQFAGNGIGLATCKKIVERHGGRIWVEPRPEGGSVFNFTLPAQSVPQEVQNVENNLASCKI